MQGTLFEGLNLASSAVKYEGDKDTSPQPQAGCKRGRLTPLGRG